MAFGLAAGTLVATPSGWRPVESLIPGDMALTFDGGMQPLRHVLTDTLWSAEGPCPFPFWPLLVPTGTLGNRLPLALMPEQYVLVESDLAEALCEDPFMLVPATALDGVLGIERVPPAVPQEVYALFFEQDEIIFVNGSALLHCPVEGAGATLPLVALAGEAAQGGYRVLPEEAARVLTADLHAAPIMNGYAA